MTMRLPSAHAFRLAVALAAPITLAVCLGCAAPAGAYLPAANQYNLTPVQRGAPAGVAVPLKPPTARVASGYSAPVFTYGAKDWNVQAESVPPVPGAKVVFYAFIERATRATWTATGFAPVLMHRGHWMFAPIGEPGQEWDGYSSSLAMIHRFASTRLDITLRMWNHSAFSMIALHWRCDDSGTVCRTSLTSS